MDMQSENAMSTATSSQAGHLKVVQVNPLRRAGRDIEYAFRTITPNEAKKLLATHSLTRKPIEKFVKAYAQSMKAGRWILNGMPILLGKSGAILDGGMRLKACVEADCDFRTLVVENVPDDILHTIDQHRRRSYQGVLQARGEKDARVLVRTLTRLIRYDEGTTELPYQHMSWMKMDRYLDKNRAELVAAVRDAVAAHKSKAKAATMLETGLEATIRFMGHRVNGKATNRFLDAITNPDNYPGGEPGRVLSQRLDAERGMTSKSKSSEIFALALKALQDTIDDKTAKVYRYAPTVKKDGSRSEEFPKLKRYTGLDQPVQGHNLGRIEGYGLEPGDDVRHRVTVETVLVTPDMAADWMKQNIGNRKIVKSTVDTIARDIANDRWSFNATPICFAHTGRMMNGQHRLQACIQAGIPIECTVVRGLDEAAFYTYDVQVKRQYFLGAVTGGDVSDERVLIAAAKLLWKEEHESADTYKVKPSPAEIREIIKKHPLLQAQVVYGRRASVLAQASVMTYFAYHVLRRGGVAGSEFLTKLETGADLSMNSPIYKLRRRLIKIRTSEKVTYRTDVLRILLAGWASYLQSIKRGKEKPAPKAIAAAESLLKLWEPQGTA